jgi:hypothetical protein
MLSKSTSMISAIKTGSVFGKGAGKTPACTEGQMTTSDATRTVKTGSSSSQRCPPVDTTRTGVLKRLTDWMASIGQPGPSIEERFARKYLATLSPDRAASLLSALALLDRVHGTPENPCPMSAAFKKEGLQRLGPLASRMTDMVKAASQKSDHPTGKGFDALRDMLEDVSNFLKTQTGHVYDKKAGLTLMHGMFDMLLEHKTLSADDLRNWLLKLSAADKRELLDVENGKTSRTGRLIQQEWQSQGIHFGKAANKTLGLLSPQAGDSTTLHAGIEAICSAASELQNLVKLTGAKDGQAACAEFPDGFEQLRGELCTAVRQFAEKRFDAASVAGLDRAHTLQFGGALRQLGLPLDAGPSDSLMTLRLESIKMEAERSRDGAMDKAIAAGGAGDLEEMRAHLQNAARQYEDAKSAANVLSDTPAQSPQDEDMDIRNWAANRVDVADVRSSASGGGMQDLATALGSPNAQAFIGSRLTEVDASAEPGNAADDAAAGAAGAADAARGAHGAAPQLAGPLSQAQAHIVKLTVEAMREHAEALASGKTGLFMLP